MERMLFVFFLIYVRCCWSYGFDSGGDQRACGRNYRSNRHAQLPCDLMSASYCTSAGPGYPWQAVKRFVKENQGLMKRMYGDQRHGQVLMAELDSLDVDDVEINNRVKMKKDYFRNSVYTNVDNELHPNVETSNQPRSMEDDNVNEDVLNTKFVYSEDPSMIIKLADLKKASYFKRTTEKTVLSSSESPTTVKEDTGTMTLESSTDAAVTSSPEVETTTLPLINSTEKLDGNTKDETVLYQDKEKPVKENVPINYQMRGVNACPVKEEVVAPFWANNTRGEVLALLNVYPFEQYVHWEKCTHENKQMNCKDGCKCEQQYRLHRLLAYDPNNECRGIFSDWFRFPSCCICKCYSLTLSEFRVTSRSPRVLTTEDTDNG